MLTKDNTGKYLTKEYHDKFYKASIDRTRYTDDEISWLALPSDLGNGKENPDTWKIDTVPIDSFSKSSKKYDIRTRPECGD